MKKIFKILLSILAIVLVFSFIVACSDKNGKTDDTTTTVNYESENTTGEKLIKMGASGAMTIGEGWKFLVDEKNEGIDKGWYKKYQTTGVDITVPGASSDVGIVCSYGWFSNKFKLNFTPNDGERVLLELGGVTYKCKVWVNGTQVGEHTGCYGAFTCDITDVVKTNGDNIVNIYCESPANDTKVDGLLAKQLPVWTSLIAIQQSAYVYAKPEVYVEDAYVQPNCENGEIKVTATVLNTTDSDKTVSGLLRVRENERNFDIDSKEDTFTLTPGENTVEMTVTVKDFTYWTIDVPFLYNVILNVGSDEYTVKTGFKTLVVNDDGYYVLNGERIYIKCSHMCTHVPGSITTTKDMTYYYNLLLYLKSCGFNSIRFLQSPAFPQILDMCDEIGLLVYQEHPMSWNKITSVKIDTLFEDSVLDVLTRDRNHVSLGMFGMLNETEATSEKIPVINAAEKTLKAARDAAPNVLFLFSSGRWDGNKSIGSASNPGSYKWDGYMGDESADATDTTRKFAEAYWSWMKGMGDIHYYPQLPWGAEEKTVIENAQNTKRAVFFSETGAGSIVNIISDYLTIAQNSTITGGTSYWNLKEHVTAYRTFYEEYGLDTIYSTPEALLKDSEAYQTKQRALVLTYIRRCANYNGYSMTMSADCGFRGEGIVNTSGEYKTGVTDMLQAGLSDLRFCISLDKPIVYSGDKLPLEIRLSNIDVLSLQTYNITIRITSEDGLVWKKETSIRPKRNSDGTFDIIFNIFNDSIDTTGWSTGKYTVGVEMTNGAHPTCGEAEFYIVNKKDNNNLKGTVYTYNVSSAVKNVLTSNGAKIAEYGQGTNVGTSTVFVGSKEAIPTSVADALFAAAKNGAHVVFLNASSLKSGETYYVPFANTGKEDSYPNWLYHFDSIVYNNSVSKKLPSRCIMDTDFYSSVYSQKFITGMSVPTDVTVAAVFTGIDGGSSKNFQSGYQLGTYAYGKGYITISTLELIDSAGQPATDTILCNLVNYSEPAYCKDRVHY